MMCIMRMTAQKGLQQRSIVLILFKSKPAGCPGRAASELWTKLLHRSGFSMLPQ